LAQKGCSFVNSPLQADWQLYITAATRFHGEHYGITTCYADVQVRLMDSHKKKSLFDDEFSQRGVAATKELAGRKALEDVAPTITNKISQWIEN
jgi:hypothetical protein